MHQTESQDYRTYKKLEDPQNVKQVQQLLGLCNYHRQFIYKFSDIAAPLSSLTPKDKKFVWSGECEESFLFLKTALSNAPVLAYPSSTETFILDTDASDDVIGAVLSQIKEGKEKVIAFASKKLDKHQRRYNVTRRELLAVVTL